jgi:hydantoinase/carbamoylase family amidase
MEPDPGRVIADLRELDRLTGGADGARRVCWTPVWAQARDFLRSRLAEIDGVEVEIDEAANLWARKGDPGDRALAVGSHIDSVPGGGWLDGALGVMAAVEVLRCAPGGVALVDFADEEGARFGRSLFGSSAVAGTLDAPAAGALRDAEGRTLREVVGEHGVDLDRIEEAQSRRDGLRAYLELHIEQGPVLESEGVPVAAVSGTVGDERHRLRFTGQASHAGTTPMDLRRDAGLSAAATALAVEQVARRHGGVGTAGVLRQLPDIPTAVPGEAELVVDLRHADASHLEQMLGETRQAAAQAAADHGCTLEESLVFAIEPRPFDTALVAAARDAAGTGRVMASGALHDAAEMARHLPVAMMFTSSTGGLSHAKEEDTPRADLERGIAAFAGLALGVAAGGIVP